MLLLMLIDGEKDVYKRQDYVSCSPFRVPIARLAAAQAAIKSSKESVSYTHLDVYKRQEYVNGSGSTSYTIKADTTQSYYEMCIRDRR